MSALDTAENAMWRQKARDVAEKVVRPLSKKYDDLQEYPWEIRDALAAAGLMKVWIPKEYGGEAGETPVLNLCIVVEEISKADPAIGVLFAVNALGSFPILVGGTEEQKQRFLPRIASGEKLVAFCLSEKTAGSDAQGLKVRAVASGEGKWKIHGEKKWTTNGGAADFYTVFAVTDPESRSRRISAFIVEKDMPGFSIGKVEDKMGIRAVPVVETVFDGVEVGEDRLLGGKLGQGFKHAMMTLDRARPGVAAQGMGCAQGALDLATVYAQRRQQFGQSIASFQMVQKMLADMATQTEAARQLVYSCARMLDAGLPNTSKVAAMAKLFSTDVAMKVTTDAVQIFGGYGFMRDYPIEKFMRDAKITQIYEGTNQVQRIVVARGILKEAEALTHLSAYIPEEDQMVYEG
ncbi:MAG: acyl-CoA dehydrogenase family protein [Planctomycetes bacterium]|nr:acyl-CoA dehydrogenase family protein [Planctomycetota bacterium]